MGKCAVCGKPFFKSVSGRALELFRINGLEKFPAHESCGKKLEKKNFKSIELEEVYVKSFYQRISH